MDKLKVGRGSLNNGIHSWQKETSVVPKESLQGAKRTSFIQFNSAAYGGEKGDERGIKDRTKSSGLESSQDETRQSLLHFRSALVNLVINQTQPENSELLSAFSALEEMLKRPLNSQERETLQKYYYYIQNGIDTFAVATMDPSWWTNVMKLIPATYRQTRYEKQLLRLASEMRDEYMMSVKKSIVDFVLKEASITASRGPGSDAGLSLTGQQDSLTNAPEDAESEYDDDELTEEQLQLKQWPQEWTNNFRLSQSTIESNCLSTTIVYQQVCSFCQNPTWSNFSIIDLDALLVTRSQPQDLRSFKIFMVQRFEKAAEKMLVSYYPALISLFITNAGRPTNWSKLQGARLAPFFKTVRLLMAEQLRSIVRRSVADFMFLFTANAAQVTKRFVEGKPLTFLNKLELDEATATVRYLVPMGDIQTTVAALFEKLLTCLDRLPVLETQLFVLNSGTTMPDIFNRASIASLGKNDTIPVNFEGTFPNWVREQRQLLHAHLSKELAEPLVYLGEFDRHANLFNKKSETAVNDLLATEPLPLDGVVNMVKVLRKQTVDQILCHYPHVLTYHLVTVHLEDWIKYLASVGHGLVERLMQAAAAENRKKNEVAIKKYEQLAEQLLQMPQCVEETVKLESALEEVKAGSCKDLEQSLTEAKKRLQALLVYYEMEPEDYASNSQLFNWPAKLSAIVAESQTLLVKAKGDEYEKCRIKSATIAEEVETLAESTLEFYHFRAVEDIPKYYRSSQRLVTRLESARDRLAQLQEEERLLKIEPVTQLSVLQQAFNQIQPVNLLYTIAMDFQKMHSSWMTQLVADVSNEAVEQQVSSWGKDLYKLLNQAFESKPAPRELTVWVKEQLDGFKSHLPLLSMLSNPGLRGRHWQQLSNHLQSQGLQPYGPEYGNATLENALQLRLDRQLESLEGISALASKELSLEKTLEKMHQEWNPIDFVVVAYRDTGAYILGSLEEMQQLLDDHLVKTQTMRGSPFVAPFEDAMCSWESKLVYMQDLFDSWLKVQATWLYLEPIFSSEDIQRQMPAEGKRFSAVDANWKRIMATCHDIPNVLKFIATDPTMHETLELCNQDLELVQKGLNSYLELKRLYFPRFFFLSNDEMLEILSETRDPKRVQPHLKKCFEGINSLEFEPDTLAVTKIVSAQQENVQLLNPVQTASAGGQVEKWLLDTEKAMLASMQHVIQSCFSALATQGRDEWLVSWPGQAVLVMNQALWTTETEEAIQSNSLGTYLELCTSRLNRVVELVRGKLTTLARATLEAVVVIDVHARDVLAQLRESNVTSLNDFEWQSQLRYYWQDGKVMVRMINSMLPYGYEYLGNSPRLVITPLTDRCYRTLFGALQLNLGGAPEGPAGTGKTETTKDLAKALAMFCVVYNCSDGLDYLAMGKFFKGVASAGAWACFDEFNRIDLEVLSVVAQQILTIQRAKQALMSTFTFEGTTLSLNPVCAVFITMNPGYAGRSELPDNLKSLFRPVAMMVPDYALIAEISLYSFGFIEARSLAVKITATYRLCSEQLSSQDHYDYGMRAVKSVLSAAGALKLKFPDESESLLLLRSITDVNLPKFLAQDIPLFHGILSDLFPGVKLNSPDYDKLNAAVLSACQQLNLQPVAPFLEKIFQIYEMMLVRHGFMIVGEAMSGKTCAYKVLQRAMTDLHVSKEVSGSQAVITGILNPKSITMGQLYGQFDPATHEWHNGVLADLFRAFASSQTPERKWLIFDGPVDAIWIENMNTVLDDNKKLCLNSGEIIQLSSTMSMMFEVRDLAVASPATVSRCGMIYMEPRVLSFDATFVSSWLSKMCSSTFSTVFESNDHRETLETLIKSHIPTGLRFLRRDAAEYSPTLDSQLVVSLLRVYEALVERFCANGTVLNFRQINACFLFSFIWSIGGCITEQSRSKFTQYVLNDLNKLTQDSGLVEDMEKQSGSGSVYDVFFDGKQWQSWMVLTPNTFEIPEGAKYDSILVPTVDSARYGYILHLLASKQTPVLFVGPTGTGKTLYASTHLQSQFDASKFQAPIMLGFSAQTTAEKTQLYIESMLDKRRKGVYGPPLGKSRLVFIDDLNMPAREKYGAQPPIELIRQWMDHRGWYNLAENTMQEIIDIQFVAAMGPPGGGRNSITSRLLRHFSTIGVPSFDDLTLDKIFSTILQWHFAQFPEAIASLAPSLISATARVYRGALASLLPTPLKSHYTFNVRDFSRVIQGLLMLKPTTATAETVVSLWQHEVDRVFGDRLIDDTDRLWLARFTQNVVKEQFSLSERDFSATPLFAAYGKSNDYEEVTDMDALTSTVSGKLVEYNALSKSPMDLVLFPFALQHLTRISRVLMQPRGHLLLIGMGGSGRQSLTRLAAYMADFETFQIEIAKGYTLVNWRDDLKKVLKKAGMPNGRPIVFIMNDTQIQQETFLEDLNSLLNSGQVPNLFANDEKVEIVEAFRAAMVKDAEQVDPMVRFLEKCRENLHIVLAMSAVGDALRNRIRKFPSLVNCCTIDWFTAWPSSALEMVAAQYLKDVEIDNEEVVKPLVVAQCQLFHEQALRQSELLLQKERRYNYVTPTSYLELIKTFKALLADKRHSVKTLKFRYLNGLEKLGFAQSSVAKMQEDLALLGPQLILAKEETDKIMIIVEKESKEVQATREVVRVDEASATEKAAVANSIKTECEAQLAEALPALEAALAALDTLKSADITVIKSMKSPPSGVKLVMEAVCIMKDIKPVKIPDPSGSGKKVEDFWGPAKTMLSDMKFLDSLKAYDRDNISSAIMKLIRSKYIENPEFDPNLIANASSAAEGLCKWVRAMEIYDRVAKEVGPKKEALAKAQAELAETMANLQEKRATLKGVEERMAALEAQFLEMTQKKDALERQVDSVEKQLARAEKLITSLGDEKGRWTECAENLEDEYNVLLGNVLVSSGIIAYLGAFPKAFRDACVNTWVDQLLSANIPCFSNRERIRLGAILGDPVQVRAWNLAGLPNDQFSTDNAIVVANARRWPLFIDPQGQANRWIRNMERSRNLQIVKQTDADFLRTLENAIQFGNPLLLENVGEDLDSALEPLLLKQTFKQGGVTCIKLGETVIEYNPDFKFYITTKLPNPHYLPQTSTKVTLVNFMITPEGLQDQLLGIVIAKERPELEEQKNQLLLQSAENKRQLQEIENKILHVLSASEGNILEDETAVQILSSSKVLAKQIAEKQTIAEQTEKNIDASRIAYQPVAMSTSVLFFCIAELASIEPMYQYSLPWFLALFVNSIAHSERSPDIGKRIEFLSNHFLESLYVNICRSLFEKDKLVFSFLLCVAIQRSRGAINAAHFNYLLNSTVPKPIPSTQLTENPNPSWISERMWSDFSQLSTLEHFEEVALELTRTAGKFWQPVYEGQDTLRHEKWPEGFSTKLNGFERLLVVKCLRPDRLTHAITQYVAETLGKRYVEPPIFDIQSCYNDSSCCTPLIFILSPGADPTTALLRFADEKKMSGKKLVSISLGQGQGPIAAKMIVQAISDGSWVILQNCHLALSWMTSLEKICEDLSPETTHKDFRLWLTTYPSAQFPVTLLQTGIKMTNEPPKGLRANLLKSYVQEPVCDKQFYDGNLMQDAFEKLLLALCFFHVVVQERRNFGPVGWNIPYEFNDTDLRISAQQLKTYLQESALEKAPVPFSALNYLVGQCNYGGRVTDDKDRRTLASLLSIYFDPAMLEASHKLASDGSVRVPTKTNYSSCVEFIKGLPNDSNPAVFCLHENAEISKNQLESLLFLQSVQSTQSQSGLGGTSSSEKMVLELATEMLNSLPEPFDMEQAREKYPVNYSESMNTVLLQELVRFQNFVDIVRGSLRNVHKAVKGLVVMSSELEDVYKSLLVGKVPQMWSAKSYPSLKPLGAYFADLLQRLNFLNQWLQHGPPVVFWLSGFFFTQSFLTGCLQNYARRYTIPIDLLGFEFIVTKMQTATQRPDDGQYVSGIFLEGARWDSDSQSLTESLPKVLHEQMPLIWLKPKEINRINTAGTYECPIYKTSARRGVLSTTGHSTNYVLSIKLQTKVSPNHWICRGVAGLLQLDY